MLNIVHVAYYVEVFAMNSLHSTLKEQRNLISCSLLNPHPSLSSKIIFIAIFVLQRGLHCEDVALKLRGLQRGTGRQQGKEPTTEGV